MKLKRIVGLLVTSMLLSSAMAVSTFAAPEEVLASGPMEVWDYYLAPYDATGKIREQPFTTAFAVNPVVDESIPRVFALPVDEGDDVIIKISGEERYKDWQKNVYKVIIKNPLHEAPTTGTGLTFVSKPEENQLVLPASNGFTNERHSITIFSKGYNIVTTTVEIQKAAPKIKLSSGEPKAGEPVSFQLENYWYNPLSSETIYQVLLDDKELKGGYEDYFAASDLLKIVNGDLITNGLHTLTVKAHGYHTARFQFLVGDASNVGTASQSIRIEAMSSATGGSSGGSGDVDGVSGATGTTINAEVIFKFDMVANAKILNELGVPTAASTKVLSEWESYQGRYKGARTESRGRFADWNDYINDAMQSKIAKDYLDFGDYYDQEGNTTHGMPFQVKFMLETGRYGDVLDGAEVQGKPVNVTVEKAVFGEPVVLKYTDEEWASKIERIKIATTQLYPSAYTIEDGTITITSDLFSSGSNDLTIVAPGYVTYTTILVMEPSEVSIEIEGTPSINDNVSFVLSEEYAGAIVGVKLNGKALSTDGAKGKDEYKVEKNRLVIFADQFKTAGEIQVVQVQASGYGDRIGRVQLAEAKTIDFADLPVIESIEETTASFVFTFDRVNKHWQESVYKIHTDILSTASSKLWSFEGNKLTISKKGILPITVNENYLKIKANGYSDVTYKKPEVPQLATPTVTLNQNDTTEKIVLSVAESEANKAYLAAVNKVLIGSQEVAFASDEQAFTITIAAQGYSSLSGEVTIVVQAGGYNNNATLKVTLTATEPEPGEPQGKTPPTKKYFDYTSGEHKLTLNSGGVQVWMNAITSITAGGSPVTQYQKYESNEYIRFLTGAFPLTGKMELRISATGYEDFVLEVTIQGLSVPSNVENASVAVGEDLELLLETSYSSTSSYIPKIRAVQINDEAVVYNTSTTGGGGYFSSYNYYLNISSENLPQSAGIYTITILAAGYKSHTITLTVTEGASANSAAAFAATEPTALVQGEEEPEALEEAAPTEEEPVVLEGEEYVSHQDEDKTFSSGLGSDEGEAPIEPGDLSQG